MHDGDRLTEFVHAGFDGANEIDRLHKLMFEFPFGPMPFGTRVRKKHGSSWQGRIVGFYSTSLTPVGYAVESEREPGSVQIYPAAALEVVTDREAAGAPSERPS